jgi:AcrR family transcriptional regulator
MTSAEVAGCPGRRPGRPRDERVDRAIIAATLELFASEGYSALSVEAVAVTAEVSKATIYRRWPGKRELVLDALATLNDDFPLLASGSIRERLLTAMRYMANRDADSLAGRIMPRMMVYSLTQPDLYAEYFDRVIMPRRHYLQTVLRDGIRSGELRADLDIETATMSIVGPVLLQVHSLGQRQPKADVPDQLMDILWPGLVAPPSGTEVDRHRSALRPAANPQP